MAAVCERFLTEHAAYHCKPSTQAEYRRSVELFIVPAMGTRRITDITRTDIAALRDRMQHIPYQANRTLGVLSKVFSLAEEWGLLAEGVVNPCFKVKRFPESKRERYLGLDELARLGETLDTLEHEQPEMHSAVYATRLLVLTGCRLGEIQTLKWEYVQGNVLRLPDSKSGAKQVYIGKPALAVLERIPRVDGNPYVITGRNPGCYLTDLQRPWRRIRARAGLDDVRIHDLRHSFASVAVGNGETLPMIGRLLGHTQVQTTARYAHLADDPMHAAAGRVAEALAEAMATRASAATG